jgi:hypothetical protein
MLGCPRITVVYEAVGDSIKATVDGVDAQGKPTHNEWTGKFDGKDYPVTGDPSSDTRSVKQIDDHIGHLERNGFNWNDIYLTTTTPGQTYIGIFADSDGTNFFFRVGDNRIVVGDMKDLKTPAKTGEEISFTAS